jgi:type II secretory pathway predicted ATPase ExeA
MYLRYFQFAKEPFGATPDSSFLYESVSHREALASLRCAFHGNRGFTALIAPPGTGKTTLLFQFLAQVRNCASSVFLFNTQFEPRELVRYMLLELGVAPGGDLAAMHHQLNHFLLQEVRAGRRSVLVIDEAQNLSESALEAVRLLSNFETQGSKLVQVILAGQLELSQKLRQRSLVQLRQRISTVCWLRPFSGVETLAYIQHRLKLAGYKSAALFSDSALHLIAQASAGIPRTINTICFNALSLCRAVNRKCVDRDMVAEVIKDLELPTEQVNAQEQSTASQTSALFSNIAPPAKDLLARQSLWSMAGVFLLCLAALFPRPQSHVFGVSPMEARSLPAMKEKLQERVSFQDQLTKLSVEPASRQA